MSDLTALQTKVLAAFRTYDTAEATKSDLGVSWTGAADLAAATGLTVKGVKGVLGSLVKAGLVQADEGADGTQAQCLTEAGVDALFALRVEQGGVADNADGGAETVEEPAEPAPQKLTFTDVATGNEVESRRVPSAHHRDNVERLVANYGGSTFTEAQAAEVGIDAEALSLLVKRFRSWFGRKSIVREGEGWMLNLR